MHTLWNWQQLVVRLVLLAVVGMIAGCATMEQPAARVEGANIHIEFDNRMYSRVSAIFDGQELLLGGFSGSESILISGEEISVFEYQDLRHEDVDDNVGIGERTVLTGSSGSLMKEVSIILYPDFPTMAIYEVTYHNEGTEALEITGWTNNSYSVAADPVMSDDPPFWSYNSASYESRQDWILPVRRGFSLKNYLGMNDSDYGGATPVGDLWRRDVGIGVGHLEMVPKLVSLPIAMENNKAATLGVLSEKSTSLAAGESFSTLRTFVSVHQGDQFATLDNYSRLMQRQGIEFNTPPASVYEPIWCAWGYRREFTMDQIYGTFPMVGKLGFDWVVLDDGWQTAEGDWYLHPNKYPNGDTDMQKFVKKINDAGFKAKLWWAPLAVDPGTDLIKEHPEYLLMNEDGSYQDITWWNSYYLCPAYPPVQEYHKQLVKTIMGIWGYSGLKIDGQHLNGAPPCYNPAHNHAYPEESVEQMPAFFKVIYDTAMELEGEAVVEICPCGTAFSFFTMPYMNQSVSSDPLNSWQVRLKGKTLKALTGNDVAYYGDHVELSDNGNDFASSVGVGAVIGTKFTWPVGAIESSKRRSSPELTPEREIEWAKWINIYRDKMLSTGEYRGDLYDLGYDRPEAHAIEKGDAMYYAFYADQFNGKVELRGLNEGSYTVHDYENNVDLGTVSGPMGTLEVDFGNHLLLEVLPQ